MTRLDHIDGVHPPIKTRRRMVDWDDPTSPQSYLIIVAAVLIAVGIVAGLGGW